MIDQLFFNQAAGVLAACRAKGLVVATAESCTGGLCRRGLDRRAGLVGRGRARLRHLFEPGQDRDARAYRRTLSSNGAPSARPVAVAMAEGALRHSRASLSVAVTGIAGPGGATETKPVGLVHLVASDQGGREHSRRAPIRVGRARGDSQALGHAGAGDAAPAGRRACRPRVKPARQACCRLAVDWHRPARSNAVGEATEGSVEHGAHQKAERAGAERVVDVEFDDAASLAIVPKRPSVLEMAEGAVEIFDQDLQVRDGRASRGWRMSRETSCRPPSCRRRRRRGHRRRPGGGAPAAPRRAAGTADICRRRRRGRTCRRAHARRGGWCEMTAS